PDAVRPTTEPSLLAADAGAIDSMERHAPSAMQSAVLRRARLLLPISILPSKCGCRVVVLSLSSCRCVALPGKDLPVEVVVQVVRWCERDRFAERTVMDRTGDGVVALVELHAAAAPVDIASLRIDRVGAGMRLRQREVAADAVVEYDAAGVDGADIEAGNVRIG